MFRSLQDHLQGVYRA